jgi:hypothetical protein
MEATLKFNLDDFDDRIAHLRCVKSLDMCLVLFELRKSFSEMENKVSVTELQGKPPMTPYELIEEFRVNFYETMLSHNVDLDELIT